MQNMSKKDLIAQLKDEVKAYDEKVELSVDVNGEEYSITIFPFFKPELVKECVDGISEFFLKANQEKLNVKAKDEDELIKYYIIKHFTNIKMTSSKKSKTIYNEFKTVSNSSIFKVLIKSFPDESIQKVYDELYDNIELNAQLENVMMKYKRQLKNLPLQNRNILGLDKVEE